MDPSAAARLGQARAESMMTDACTIVRLSATPVTNPVTGVVTRPETEMYAGVCRVRPGGARQVEAGGQVLQAITHTVSVPVSHTDVLPDDVVIVTASGDPALVEARLRVREVARGTHITARRLGCEELT
jgi:hypothetical protein